VARETLLRQWRRLPHPLRWAGVAAVGGTLIVVGVVLLVLPGPGLVLIALGVAVLATEFAWAESILHRMKAAGSAAADGAKRMLNRRGGSVDRQPRPLPGAEPLADENGG
jgi:uncharacterized protein (TIGR02611 family)